MTHIPTEALFATLAALVTGGRIQGALPTRQALHDATGASTTTIDAAVAALRERGLITQAVARRPYQTTVPEMLQNDELVTRMDDLADFAYASGIRYDDLRHLLAAAMIAHSIDRETDAEPAELVAEAIPYLLPVTTSNQAATGTASPLEEETPEWARAAREELEADHGY